MELPKCTSRATLAFQSVLRLLQLVSVRDLEVERAKKDEVGTKKANPKREVS